MYGEGRIAGVIEIFKRSFSFCERTGAFSLIKTKIVKKSVKKIRELIVFTAFLVVALWKFNVVLDVLKAIWGIVFPFVLGGAIAFVTNVPMSFLEKKIFENVKKENKKETRKK